MDPTRWNGKILRRAAVVRIYEVGERLVALGPEGGGHELTGDSAALARALLGFLEQPHTYTEVLAHLEELTGAPIEQPAVIDELLGLLLGVRAIEEATPRPPRRAGPGPRVVLGLTGAVATMHAPALIQRLQARGFEVRVAATEDALRFVRCEAIEALTHRPVVRGLWPAEQGQHVPHIELAQWADVVAIAPASATTIARLATGDYASVVAAVALATRAPVLVVPSMNPAMYEGAPVQRNLAQLIADGMHVAHPARGVEVAERPDERTPLLGGGAPPDVVVALLEAILRAQVVTTTGPRGREAWDRLHRTAAALPWQAGVADVDMLAALAEVAPTPTSVLEVGAGQGQLAAAAAARGHRVVAADISAVALAQGPEAAVVRVQDDITDTRLCSRFAVVLDRACLGVLAADEVPRYVAALTRLCEPGGAVIVKTLAEPVAGATAYTAATITAAFAPAFTLEREAASTLPGPGRAPAARLFVLRRT